MLIEFPIKPSFLSNRAFRREQVEAIHVIAFAGAIVVAGVVVVSAVIIGLNIVVAVAVAVDGVVPAVIVVAGVVVVVDDGGDGEFVESGTLPIQFFC